MAAAREEYLAVVRMVALDSGSASMPDLTQAQLERLRGSEQGADEVSD